jgi:hypothetical protein
MKAIHRVNSAVSAAQIKRALAERLRGLLGEVEWLRDVVVAPAPAAAAGFDLDVTADLPVGGQVRFAVLCRSELRPGVFQQWAARKAAGRERVLGLPVVSPRLAALCVEHGWSWFDLAGNHRFNVQGLLRMERSGLAPVMRRERPVANLGTPEAGRLLRALLTPENAGLNWTQLHLMRHFAELAEPVPGPSLGLVNKVVRHLRDEGYLEVGKSGRFRVVEPLAMLTAWRQAYRFDQQGRQGYFSLLKGERLREALMGLAATGNRAAYAAFSAADFQAPNVRQLRTWLYLAPGLEAEFCRRLEAKPVDTGENLMVLWPEDEGVFYQCDQVAGRMAATNPVQTYVDLCHCGGRGEEAAAAVLEQCLKPAWKRGEGTR